MKSTEWGAVVYLAHSKYGRNGTEITINDNISYYTGGGNYASNVAQSTTGNVYGVYDINGGSFEYAAAGLTANVTSTFGSLTGFDEKYVNRYTGSSSDGATNYTANSSKYGDAIYETSSDGTGATSWFGNYSYFPFSSSPFIKFSADYYNAKWSGAFSYLNAWGGGDHNYRLPSGHCCVVLRLA